MAERRRRRSGEQESRVEERGGEGRGEKRSYEIRRENM